MLSRAAIEALSARLGIDPTYTDVFGQLHRVSDATLLAFCAALSEAPADDAAAHAAIAALDAQDWSRPLPAACVARVADDAVTLPLRLPADEADRPLRFRLALEDGAVHEGEVLPATLAPRDARMVAGREHRQFDWPLPGVPMGYHAIELTRADGTRLDARLIACPPACLSPDEIAPGRRLWGPAVQLYAVRSARNWGMGDFGDLVRIVEAMAAAGAGLVGLNPLHALFPDDPSAASPYSPSNRAWLNPLYLDIEALDEFAECDAARARVADAAFAARLDALRAAEFVDYPGVAAAKFELLDILWQHFRDAHAARGTVYAAAFEAFRAAGGDALAQHARFEALQAHRRALDAAAWGWPAWPAALQDRDGPEVARAAGEQAERVAFFAWLQWLAERQLGQAAQRARALGMPVGLYRDLAVGVASGGSETWSAPTLYALGARVGAPPDEFNPAGQDWGLPPMIPSRLAQAGYQPFIDVLRANMRHAGALRIDHVMGLMRLYWVPPGAPAADGAYVHYPLEALAGIVALESRRNGCAIVGEDLGTVPDAVRATMAARALLSYRPLYFEREGHGAFRAPADVPARALVALSTHDLPTLAGFWASADIAARDALGLFPTEAIRARTVEGRAQDRVQLLRALAREALLPPGVPPDPQAVPELDDALVAAVHAYLARTPARLLVFQLEDAFGQREQVNLPGTTEAVYPNWRRKLAVPLERWGGQARLARLLEALAAERGRAVPPGPSGGPAGSPSESPAGSPPESPTGGPLGGPAGGPAGGPRESPAGGSPEGPPSGSPEGPAGASPGQGPAAAAASGAGAAVPAIPRAAYRVQFHAGFTFADAARIVPYLAALGVSHLYASPYLKARPGSTHGYDIIDHNALNPEIGTPADFDRLCDTLAAHGLGQMLDIVPNHMGVLGSDNGWWLDVLENGRAARHAGHFDIDWGPAGAHLADKVLVPVLGDQYGTVLDRGELQLVFDAATGEFAVRYYEHRFPIDPREYPAILEPAVRQARAGSATSDPGALPGSASALAGPTTGALPEPTTNAQIAINEQGIHAKATGEPAGGQPAARPPDETDLDELASLAAAFGHLPGRREVDPARVAERARDAAIHKRRLAGLCARCPGIAQAIEQAVRRLNGTPGEAASFEPLHALLEAQAFRLAYWRVASDDINYRRFFDINDLAALRMESREVFDDVHRLVFRLLDQGRVHALRIDHPDGLYDPGEYFERLQQRAAVHLRDSAGCAGTATGRDAAGMATGRDAAARSDAASSDDAVAHDGAAARSDPAANVNAAARNDTTARDGAATGNDAATGNGAAGGSDAAASDDAMAAGDATPSAPPPERPLYLVVEKILAEHERLPERWPVHGETGYRFANLVGGLFVDGSARARFDRIYAAFTGEPTDYDEILYQAKKLILASSLSSEFTVLSNTLARIARADRHTRDFTLNRLRAALAEVVAAFPVYRSYIAPGRVTPLDRRYVDWAVSVARKRARQIDASLFDFIRDVLLVRAAQPGDDASADLRAFVGRFQQLTAPVTAKAMEDTSFYRFNRLASVNEVGGDPRTFGVSVAAFHNAVLDRARLWPNTLLATSTHDTKRGEDVRARIDVLTEMPARWRLALRRWGRLNARRRTEVDGRPAPSRNDEYLLYQTLLGAWPFDEPDAAEPDAAKPDAAKPDAAKPDAAKPNAAGLHAAALDAFHARINQYMVKAVREAKVHTSWISPNADYERALAAFIDAILDPSPRNRFLPSLLAEQRIVARFGIYNSLSQTLVKLTAPGVPDVYQGCELWNLSLVDPDNRRPVDYAQRAALLRRLDEAFGPAWPSGGPDAPASPESSVPLASPAGEHAGPRSPAAEPAAAAASATEQAARSLLDAPADGAIKLHLVRTALALRARWPDLFERGRYVPLAVRGGRAEHVCAFARMLGARQVIVIAPRLLLRLAGSPEGGVVGSVWDDTVIELPEPDTPEAGAPQAAPAWRDLLTGAEHAPQRGGQGARTLALAEALRTLPLALLVPAGALPDRAR